MTLKHVLKYFNKTELQEDKTHPNPPLKREGVKVSCAEHTEKDLSSNRPIVLTTFKKAAFTKPSRGTSEARDEFQSTKMLNFRCWNERCRLMRGAAFTLAEVLITLAIIGVVAAVTMSTIKHIRYAGYAQTFLKTYSEIQQAHNSVVSKYGDPSTWPFVVRGVSTDNSGIEQIASWYMDEFKTTKRCMVITWDANECRPTSVGATKWLSGEPTDPRFYESDLSYAALLPDGRLIQIGFLYMFNAVFWGYPKIYFIVDVNGRFKKPNQVGRDIFLIAMDKNSSGQYAIQPITRTYDISIIMADTCKPDSTGFSCSENIIRDHAMKY